jgi:hypothetical protein|tara:strand:- start:505 stop:798 length:294 start_codon:yes stop_codon:yes gene_type:complete
MTKITDKIEKFKSPSEIILDIELPLEQRVRIINPIYIPKLNERFIVEFSNFIDNKEITEKLEDMDDNEQFIVTDYFSVLYKDTVIIYISIGWKEEEK